jgi:pyrroloquinoline-quinone synthase
MSRASELRAIIDRHDLNTHPFYVDWRMGTLPMEKLQDYAHGYGRFIGAIASGWDAAGEPGIGDVERAHVALWNRFAEATDGTVGDRSPANRSHFAALESSAKAAFCHKPEALGALYAFERQQPTTASTKLDGLKEHYPISDAGREYFEVHKDDWDEPALLERKIDELTDSEFARAKTACAVICTTMWMALDGAYYN